MAEKNLKIPLFLTRLSVFYFLFPWVLARFTNPDLVQGVAKSHYYTESFPNILNLGLGVFGMAALIAFLVGIKKRISYAAVFLIHAVGTVLIIPKMILFTDNIVMVFLASLPALAAIALLYCLRDEDSLLSLNK
jgi:hypothetical protein